MGVDYPFTCLPVFSGPSIPQFSYHFEVIHFLHKRGALVFADEFWLILLTINVIIFAVTNLISNLNGNNAYASDLDISLMPGFPQPLGYDTAEGQEATFGVLGLRINGERGAHGVRCGASTPVRNWAWRMDRERDRISASVCVCL